MAAPEVVAALWNRLATSWASPRVLYLPMTTMHQDAGAAAASRVLFHCAQASSWQRDHCSEHIVLIFFWAVCRHLQNHFGPVY